MTLESLILFTDSFLMLTQTLVSVHSGCLFVADVFSFTLLFSYTWSLKLPNLGVFF